MWPSHAYSRISLPRSFGDRQTISLPSDLPANILRRVGTTTWQVNIGLLRLGADLLWRLGEVLEADATEEDDDDGEDDDHPPPRLACTPRFPPADEVLPP